MYKNQNVSYLLDAAIESVDQTNKLNYTIANGSGLVDPMNFDVKYTIPHSDSKDILLGYVSDFIELMDEVTAMKAATFKLFIFEHKVSSSHLYCHSDIAYS